MNKDSRIYVAGSEGMVGSAIVRKLKLHGYENLILPPRDGSDLRQMAHVRRIFVDHRPEYVLLAAAKVGGIAANASKPVDFLEDNLLIAANIIHCSFQYDAKRLCYLGSSCIYPRDCPQPIKEEYLLTGPLEPTNQWYAVAKIAGLKLCEAYHQQHGFSYVAPMPTNLYGPEDNFDQQTSHVIPALIARLHAAKCQNLPAVNIWGTGEVRREFLHVDDCVDACVFLMNGNYTGTFNVGCGKDMKVRELATLIQWVVGYKGELQYDTSRPDGTPRKLLDVRRMNSLGWVPRIGLAEGLGSVYRWYLEKVVT